MPPSRNPGRVVGLWYLLLVFIGPLRLIYIPTKLFVAGNATATAANIVAHESLFRAGIAADLAGSIVLVMLTLAFYRMFAGVDRNLAVMVVIFGGVMPALLYIVGAASDLGTLFLLKNSDYLSAFDKPQRDALAILLLKLRDCQIAAAETLWGVWLLPLAALIYRSRFLPRFLAVWLVLGGIGWIAISFTTILWPQYRSEVFMLSQPGSLSEVALTLWLLIKGAKPPAQSMTATY